MSLGTFERELWARAYMGTLELLRKGRLPSDISVIDRAEGGTFGVAWVEGAGAAINDWEARMKEQGAHYCPDWDYMLIWEDGPEKEGCTCSK